MRAFHEFVQTLLCRKIATNGSGDCLYEFHNCTRNPAHGQCYYRSGNTKCQAPLGWEGLTELKTGLICGNLTVMIHHKVRRTMQGLRGKRQMTHKQYGLIFLLFAVSALCLTMVAKFTIVCALLCWLTVSCIWVASAFFLHHPEMLMGKWQNGTVFLPFCVINLPFLVIYWIAWLIRHFVLHHEPIHRIVGTNVFISCWPGFHVPLDCYDLVIDATSEMPKCPKIAPMRYVCLPNLDGVPLDRYELPVEIHRDMQILAHCAQGRGRSAIVACLLLLKLGHAETVDEAFSLLKLSRPSVTLSRHQRMHLESLVREDCRN